MNDIHKESGGNEYRPSAGPLKNNHKQQHVFSTL